MMDIFRDLYQQLIIDHNENPRNFHEIKDAKFQADGQNPLCGDELSVYINEQNGVIVDIAFMRTGCAIAKASASIMTSTIKGMTVDEAKTLFEKFHILATTGESTEDLGKLAVLGGVHKYPSRVKCATLAWHTFQGALSDSQETIKTE